MVDRSGTSSKRLISDVVTGVTAISINNINKIST